MAKASLPNNAAASPRRLRVLVAALVLVASGAGAWWIYRAWPATLPEVPVVDLTDVDPEVAEAISSARAALVKQPRSLEAWGKLGMVLHAHHFNEQAITCYAAAAALDRSNPTWPYYQGVLLQAGADPMAALPSLQRAARLAPRDTPTPRLRLAELLFELGRPDEAEKDFRMVHAGDAGNVRAVLGLAHVAMARKNYEDALEHLRPIAEDARVRKRAAALAAAAYLQLGMKDEARNAQGRLATLPDDPPWPDLLDPVNDLRVGLVGRLERAKSLVHHDPNAAVALMDETVRRYPESDQAWVALGAAREFAKDFAGAEQAFEKSIALAPKRADHHFYLAEFLRGQKRFKEAADAYRKASELRPHDADTHLRLGECLQEVGDRPGAIEAYRAALRCRPDLVPAQMGLKKLTEK
ncbi:MAG: tetratricopeptide repeat protein [Planctomycetes bacterium]|nr:tetratricopeptide repeat protein [Planctomycetota bacterium]